MDRLCLFDKTAWIASTSEAVFFWSFFNRLYRLVYRSRQVAEQWTCLPNSSSKIRPQHGNSLRYSRQTGI